MNSPYYGAAANAEQAINRLLDLNASGKEQDWEIEFADPSKIEIMLDHLENRTLDTPTRSALCLLLIASLDEAFDHGSVSCAWKDRATSAIAKEQVVLEQMRFFWLDLRRAIHENQIRKLLST
jgi:hypothetical protein